MIETIQTLKMFSSILMIFAFLMILLSIFVVWRYNLLDYYRVRRGKPQKNKKNVVLDTKDSQYYSESFSEENESHEITNEGYMEDDSTSLQNEIKLGEISDGVVNQIIDDDEEESVITPGFQKNYLGEEETGLLQRVHSIDSEEETTALKTDFSGEEETSVLVYDKILDETAVTVIGGTTTKDNIPAYDETAVVVIEGDGEEETSILSSSVNSTTTTETIHFVDETEVTTISPIMDEQKPVFSQSDEYSGEEETSVLTNYSDKLEIDKENDKATSKNEFKKEIMDLDGSDSTVLLKHSEEGDVNAVSHALWGPQTNIFADDDDNSVICHFISSKKEN